VIILILKELYLFREKGLVEVCISILSGSDFYLIMSQESDICRSLKE